MKSFSIPPASDPLLQGRTDTISLTWYRFLSSLLNTPQAFTPVDKSAANPPVPFYAIDVQYVVINNLVHVYGTISYSANSSTDFAAMSLPITPAPYLYAGTPCTVVTSAALGFALALLPFSGFPTAVFINQETSMNVTNAALSGAQVQFMLIYPGK